MSLYQTYLRVLSAIVPAGAAGVSMLLGAAAPSLASPEPPAAQPKAAQTQGVAERLTAIRDAASQVARHDGAAPGDALEPQRLAWGNWWRNWGWRPPGGWGWPNWNNWHNWNNWPNWWRNW
jgi:hypothetical protein